MGFEFPKVTDQKLNRSPLVEVVCQVRFDPILTIANSEPVAFQERIRSRFPRFSMEDGVSIHFPLQEQSGPSGTPFASRLYRFYTRDNASSVSLSSDFYALSTTNYSIWASFSDDLAFVGNAAQETYGIPYATRIGLRYINDITYENSDSRNPEELLGILRRELTSGIFSDVLGIPDESLSQVLGSQDDLKLLIRTGFKKSNDDSLPGASLLLDFDCYQVGELEVENLADRCERYHDLIYQAFRWTLDPSEIHRFKPSEE